MEEVKNLKIVQELQSVLLCEVNDHKINVEEDKVMIEDDKSILINTIQEKTLVVQRIASMQLDTM